MATYFVRKTGLDSNDGLSAGAAFLTIDKAANTVTGTSGDTVYVGAGVYRELVTMDTSGNGSGNLIEYIADVDGSQTGDPGLVILSAYANETSAATRASCWNPNGKEFITVRGFTMTGGTSGVVYDGLLAGDRAYEEVTFEDCVIVSGHDDQDYGVYLDLNQGATPTSSGLTIRRCVIWGSIHIIATENATAAVDAKMSIESNVFLVMNNATQLQQSAVYWNSSGTSTYPIGGVTVTNCTMVGYYAGVYSTTSPSSPTVNIDVRNCWIGKGYAGLWEQTNNGFITSDYNTFAQVQFATSNVTAGGNDRSVTTDPGLFGGIGDYTLHRFLGWSPWRPWEPIRVDDGVDAYTHAVIGDGSTTDAPAFDLYNENRPMWGTVDDRGAVEGRARPEKETTTVRTGTNAIMFGGAGYHDWLIPVKAQSTTVSIYGRYDSNYTGSLPILEVFNIDGVADQSDVMVAAANTWEELTATFTPTADGVCRVRVRSQDTSATGEAFFDDLTVT